MIFIMMTRQFYGFKINIFNGMDSIFRKKI